MNVSIIIQKVWTFKGDDRVSKILKDKLSGMDPTMLQKLYQYTCSFQTMADFYLDSSAPLRTRVTAITNRYNKKACAGSVPVKKAETKNDLTEKAAQLKFLKTSKNNILDGGKDPKVDEEVKKDINKLKEDISTD